MLNTVEAEAGMPKMKREFSIPITAAASETKRMNGNITRVRLTASSNLPGTLWKPKLVTSTISGAPMMATTETTPMMKIIALRVRLASCQAGASPSLSQMRVKRAVKAVESEPSAKRSRSRLGIWNAAR